MAEIEGEKPPWEIRQIAASEYLASQPLGTVSLRSASLGGLPPGEFFDPMSGGASGPKRADLIMSSISLRAAASSAGAPRKRTVRPSTLRATPMPTAEAPA